MIIPVKTQMLLFRFSNYGKNKFIDEHIKVLNDKGFVWMMKIGKRTNVDKINEILRQGGYLVLKSPVRDGEKYYLAQFTEVKECEPDEEYAPEYYSDIYQDELLNGGTLQIFKIKRIEELNEKMVKHLRLKLNGRLVADVIKETRTSVMFIENDKELIV